MALRLVEGGGYERWGEVPVAFVVRRPGATVAEDALSEFCLARPAKFKVPRAVHFIEALPATRPARS